MGCFSIENTTDLFIYLFQDNGVKVRDTLQIRLWIMSSEVKGLVEATLSWVDPTSFVAMNSNTRFLYFTKLPGNSLDFYFLVGTHLKPYWWCLHWHSYEFTEQETFTVLSLSDTVKYRPCVWLYLQQILKHCTNNTNGCCISASSWIESINSSWWYLWSVPCSYDTKCTYSIRKRPKEEQPPISKSPFNLVCFSLPHQIMRGIEDCFPWC